MKLNRQTLAVFLKGHCYKGAFILAMVRKDILNVVHGTVQAEEQAPLPHAWVEFKSGDKNMVYDATINLITSRQKYYSTFLIQDFRRYSFKEANKLSKQFKTFGPWDETFLKTHDEMNCERIKCHLHHNHEYQTSEDDHA